MRNSTSISSLQTLILLTLFIEISNAVTIATVIKIPYHATDTLPIENATGSTLPVQCIFASVFR